MPEQHHVVHNRWGIRIRGGVSVPAKPITVPVACAYRESAAMRSRRRPTIRTPKIRTSMRPKRMQRRENCYPARRRKLSADRRRFSLRCRHSPPPVSWLDWKHCDSGVEFAVVSQLENRTFVAPKLLMSLRACRSHHCRVTHPSALAGNDFVISEAARIRESRRHSRSHHCAAMTRC